MTTQFNDFSQSELRTLPVIVLADVSGSMAEHGKIDALNQAMRDMLAAFASGDDLRAEIQVAVITFGGSARLHVPLQPAHRVRWIDMEASGGTPMGAAMGLAADLIEDRGLIGKRAYRPMVVLVSDGAPTDRLQPSFDRLTKEGRAHKAHRLAMAIGADCDLGMMRSFVPPDRDLFVSADARRIGDFFEFVTMTTTSRTRAIDPNDIPDMQDPFGLDRM
jgi:uncharacterized protein YegL